MRIFLALTFLTLSATTLSETILGNVLTNTEVRSITSAGVMIKQCANCEFTFHKASKSYAIQEYNRKISSADAAELLLKRTHDYYEVGLGEQSGDVYWVSIGGVEGANIPNIGNSTSLFPTNKEK